MFCPFLTVRVEMSLEWERPWRPTEKSLCFQFPSSVRITETIASTFRTWRLVIRNVWPGLEMCLEEKPPASKWVGCGLKLKLKPLTLTRDAILRDKPVSTFHYLVSTFTIALIFQKSLQNMFVIKNKKKCVFSLRRNGCLFTENTLCNVRARFNLLPIIWLCWWQMRYSADFCKVI